MCIGYIIKIAKSSLSNVRPCIFKGHQNRLLQRSASQIAKYFLMPLRKRQDTNIPNVLNIDIIDLGSIKNSL